MIIEHTKRYIRISFDFPLRTLCSAVYGGGSDKILNIVNLSASSKESVHNDPAALISYFLDKTGLRGKTVGLFTSAPMEYAQSPLLCEQGIHLLAVVTAGVSNALNIAERSPSRFSGEPMSGKPMIDPGTINIIAITNARLLDECMVSSVITATEAKAAALYDLKIKSVVSGKQATGTGTDAVVIVSGEGRDIQYAGGHTLYGQLLGQAVYTGVRRALLKKKNCIENVDEIYKSFDF